MTDNRDPITPTPWEAKAMLAFAGVCISAMIGGVMLDNATKSSFTSNEVAVSSSSAAPPPEPAPSYSSPEPVLPSRDTVAANILAVACGNQVGLVAYDAIGGQLKGLLEGDGINPEEVHSNWDHYYSRAKEMDAIKGYGCIR